MRTIRSGIKMLGMLLFALSVTGCTQQPAPVETEEIVLPEEEKPFLLKAASDILPQSKDYENLEKMKEEIEAASGGSLEVQLYPGGQLGGQSLVLEGLRTETVEMAVLPFSSLEGMYPGLETFLAPFQNMDEDGALELCASERMAEELETIRAQTGIRVLALGVKGTRNIWTKKQIEPGTGLSELRLCVLDTPSYIEAFRELGALPSAMLPAQVYDGLKTGLLDGAEMDLDAAAEFNICEPCRYCLESRHGVSIQAVLVSDIIYQSMSQENQKIVQEAAVQMEEEISHRCMEQDAQLRNQMEERGVLFYTAELLTVQD